MGAAPRNAAERGHQPQPVLAVSPIGRRRRPSGEPPPLPRRIQPSTKWYLVLVAVAAALWIGLSIRPALAAITVVDDTALRLLARVRFHALTSIMLALEALGSRWTIRVVAWCTLAVLIAVRRFQHLAAYLVVLAATSLATSWVILAIGRMRPTGVDVLGHWSGYAHPSRPVVDLALVLAGCVYTLVPGGRGRIRATMLAAVLLAVLVLARLYLAVDHPSDVFTALVLGWAVPVVGFRLAVPDDVFPVSYRRGRRAHLDVGGRRGEAIVAALDHQLGLDVAEVKTFGLEGSAGSTPLRVVTRGPDGTSGVLFAKLYARSHLRADRWYKLTRTIVYGRLEDEKPFSTVRRLVEYEDHMLRLLRDAGLPVPLSYGFAEITPEREYLIVMSFFEGAEEIGRTPVDDETIDQALAIVRRLWDAGVAHRDIKPSNVLVQDGRVLLIDVAFATVRPTPWRQAVDLANMMLTLALTSTPGRVYERALRLFAPEDIAEAFAASRGVTIPSGLRSRLRADGRDLTARFCELAPERPPVPVQLWSLKRVGVTVGVLGLLGLAGALVVTYVRLAGLL